MCNTGPAFDNVGKDCDIFPSVGLRHSGEAIRVNFGHEQFKFDIEFHVQQQRNDTWAKIQCTPLDKLFAAPAPGSTSHTDPSPSMASDLVSEERVREPIHRLVLEYLAHHGYARTARAFKAQCDRRRGLDADATSGPSTGAGPARGGGADPDVEMGDESGRRAGDDLELRTRIVGAVVAGEMDAALAETRARYPGVLEEANGLMLIKMRCRKFVEMVLEAAEAQRRVRAESEDGVVLVGGEDEDEEEEEEERMVMIGVGADGMDVDDDAPMAGSSDRTGVTNGYVTVRGPGEEGALSVSVSPGAGAEEGLLLKALAYGRALDAKYNLDGRPEVRAICERTFAILASKDLATASGAVAEVVGHEARVALANELNQAILSAWCFLVWSWALFS